LEAGRLWGLAMKKGGKGDMVRGGRGRTEQECILTIRKGRGTGEGKERTRGGEKCNLSTHYVFLPNEKQNFRRKGGAV